MEKRNIKFLKLIMLIGAVLVYTNIRCAASSKGFKENIKVGCKENIMVNFKFVETKITTEDGQRKIIGSLPIEIDQVANKLNILKANSELLGINNFDTMELTEVDYGLYAISNFYQVVDGYKVDTNSIFFQPGVAPKKDNKNLTQAFIVVTFDNNIFNNLGVAKNPVNISLEKAITIARDKVNIKDLDANSEIVITKKGDKYYKAYKIEIGNKGVYVDTTNGDIIGTYNKYIGFL